MNVLRSLMPGWRWVLCALAIGLAVAAAWPAYGAISGKRWTIVPTDYVSDLSFDGSGTMWAKGYYNKIYSLQPATDTLTTWTHANNDILGANHYGMAVVSPANANHVWATATSINHVNRLDVSSGQLLSWAFPASTTCAEAKNLAVDSTGSAWFGKNDSKIAQLDPATNMLKEWPMPTGGTYCPQVVASEGSGASQKVWFCEATIDKIGYLAPSTGSVTEWTIPGNPAVFNSCNPPVGGKIWFSHSTAQVRRLDTATNELSTWACQMGCGIVYGISQESAGKVWFSDATDLISFDPVAAQFVEYTGLGCGVYSPFVDGSGNIWTTQNGGTLICRFPPP